MKKQKQRWIPTALIEQAEELAQHIRKKQAEGEFFGYNYPMNIRGSHLIVMAIAIGLKKIARDVGYEPVKTPTEPETPKKEEKTKEPPSKDKEFLEKLIGG